MAPRPKKTKKRPAVKTKSPAAPTNRRLKRPQYRSLRLSQRIKHPSPKLPNVFTLMRASLSRLKSAPRLFIALVLMYGLLTIILVRGLSGGLNIGQLNGNAAGGVYQSLLVIIFSLIFIWSLRQIQAGEKIGVRDALYKSLYPLIPFLLVLLVIGLQLLPLLVGSSIYGTVISNGIAVTSIEKVVWVLLFFALALLTLYMLSSSLFALYIVTLPDMTPMRALRAARELVRYRRWTVLRKILFLPVVLIVLGGVVVVPVAIWLTSAEQWVLFACGLVALALVHSYMYNLYRELL